MRKCLAGIVVVVGLLTCAGPALADSATLTVTTTGGMSDPAAGVPRLFTFSGTAAVPEEIFVRERAAGGAACAPSASTDSGDDFGFYGTSVNGTFNLQYAATQDKPGAYVFCIWLAPSSGSVATPITQTVVFRSPVGTISATVNPITPRPNKQATITITGSSESPEAVFATVRPAGGTACAPTYAADTGTGLVSNQSVNGAFSITATTTQAAGNYVICLWLAGFSSDPAPIAGPQTVAFTVQPVPLPHCLVPSVGHSRLATVEQRLLGAHCLVGKVTSAHSSTVRKGGVIRLSPVAGTQRSYHAHINIVVSSGPVHHHHKHHH